MRTSEINLAIDLSDDGVEGIRWTADEAPEPGVQQAKAMILSLWDANARNAMRIDLWTGDMSVDDMNDFVFQTLISLADTYRNATGNEALMAEMKLFASQFAEQASRVEQNRTQPRT
jgi:gliding motility-associated protein GldC